MKRSILFSGLLAVGLLATGSAFAGTATSSFTAGVVVNAACDISGTTLAFGSMGILADANHGVTGADNIQAQSALTLHCTTATPVTVAISANGTAGKYTMKSSGGFALVYRVFQDAAYSQPWGSTAGTNVLALTTVVGTNSVPVYGEILGADNSTAAGAGQQPVLSGSYTDTVTAVVTF